MKTFVPQKIASRTNTKKDIFQKHKDQNQKLSTPMNYQQTHSASKNQKVSLYFLVVKTEETFSSRDQTLVELPICDDNFFQTKNHHSANPLLQRSLIQ